MVDWTLDDWKFNRELTSGAVQVGHNWMNTWYKKGETQVGHGGPTLNNGEVLTYHRKPNVRHISEVLTSHGGSDITHASEFLTCQDKPDVRYVSKALTSHGEPDVRCER